MVTSLSEKIEDFLANDPKIPDDIIFRASQMFNNKLGKFNFKRRGGARLPSMSQVGKPFCQLHAEKLGWEKLPEVNSFKIKMLYGDMTEVIAVALLLAAGIEIVDLNKRVLLNTEAGDISGELDLIIRDGNSYSLWDIKSASKFAFEKKFESYQALKDNDDLFGGEFEILDDGLRLSGTTIWIHQSRAYRNARHKGRWMDSHQQRVRRNEGSSC